MRKMLLALVAMLMLIGGTVSSGLAQDDATPEADDIAPAEGTNPVDPEVGDTVTYYAENGDAVATVTVSSIERGWEGYDEYSEPDRGMEYVAFTIEVESTIERGAIDVEPYDFSLQTASGGYWGTSYAAAEQAEPPLLEDAVSLADGDSEEFTIVFSVLEDEPLAHLFWGPDSGVFLTVAQLENE